MKGGSRDTALRQLLIDDGIVKSGYEVERDDMLVKVCEDCDAASVNIS